LPTARAKIPAKLAGAFDREVRETVKLALILGGKPSGLGANAVKSIGNIYLCEWNFQLEGHASGLVLFARGCRFAATEHKDREMTGATSIDAISVLTQRVSPLKLVEPGPDAAAVERILAAAARAPDHGQLRPWRFVLIEGEARNKFGDALARSLQRREPQAPAGKLEAERKKAFRAPTILVVGAVTDKTSSVPAIEQILGAGAAAQNALLATHALGLGGFWRTGAAAYDAEVKRELGLAAEDQIVAFLYLGSIGTPGKPPSDPPQAATRLAAQG
jgi:nitroreductase